ncbi:metallophosphoesterase [Streptomyces sp. UNOB3_S3]|uniref:metallophosphoesterase n=1 Tax=Streptomyces sp. UNOB3_S3 TaxID=2871682 RepID=UPI001E636FBD|nr:metallophosphoesterase [Streptomyces sp. UNOB3_S3]MCC3777895.1 metallophosphoesterase [Streptomyces sp. UNOB3_S3]
MTSVRVLERIVATTDVHSAFDRADGMLAYLHRARPTSLIADCGDFFEGSGYYRLAGGAIERAVLAGLYDVLAPGNHGWPHHFEPELRPLTVCTNAVDDASGQPLFRRLRTFRIGGRRVAVTAVIGPDAFMDIPAHQRQGQRVTDPVRALRELMLAHHHEADAWMLLSHSGFEQDLALAAECPFLDVIFAGHCHSDHYAPEPVGDTLVVKGGELGAGYALAEPVGAGWAARTCTFPTGPAAVPHELASVVRQIGAVREKLTAPLGLTADAYRGTVPDRHHVLAEAALRLHSGLGADAVVLNDTVLRPQRLGMVLTFGDLLAIEPFANQLAYARIPDSYLHDPGGLTAYLTARVGPLVTAPDPLPIGLRTVLTTDFLAGNFLGDHTRRAGMSLGQAVRHVLTGAPSSTVIERPLP